jgi:hypothetical protein
VAEGVARKRSSRAIERACVEDVACRVVAANLVPDHSTIAEFRVRHEAALAELFTGVLGLCRQAGLVSVGVVAIDGTKIQANASREANRSYEQIAREIHGRGGGDGPPRVSSTVRRAAMSCRSGCERARGGAPRCGRQRSGSSAGVSQRGQTLSTLRALAWRSSSIPSACHPQPWAAGLVSRGAPRAR